MLAQALGPVIERLGGALCTEPEESLSLEEVIEADLAGRTSVVYRNGELVVAAATNGDATLLTYQRDVLARWARERLSLDAEPRVRVVVARGGDRKMSGSRDGAIPDEES